MSSSQLARVSSYDARPSCNAPTVSESDIAASVALSELLTTRAASRSGSVSIACAGLANLMIAQDKAKINRQVRGLNICRYDGASSVRDQTLGARRR
jgi:hypothetical protein